MIQFTPFHLLATESKAHTDHDHQWSKETLKQLSATNSTLILTTPYKVVELAE
jgi:protein phosphatase